MKKSISILLAMSLVIISILTSCSKENKEVLSQNITKQTVTTSEVKAADKEYIPAAKEEESVKNEKYDKGAEIFLTEILMVHSGGFSLS